MYYLPSASALALGSLAGLGPEYLSVTTTWEPFAENCCRLAQSCPALCDCMDCNPSGSPVYGISQARILAWIAISSPSGSSQPRDWTCICFISGRFFTTAPAGKRLAGNRTSNSVLYSTPGLNWAWTKQPVLDFVSGGSLSERKNCELWHQADMRLESIFILGCVWSGSD